MHLSVLSDGLEQILTVITLLAHVSCKQIELRWYYIFAAVISGILIAYITMYGWDKLIERFKKFYKKDLK